MEWILASYELLMFLSLGLVMLLLIGLGRKFAEILSTHTSFWKKTNHWLNLVLPVFFLIYCWYGIRLFTPTESWQRSVAFFILLVASFLLGFPFLKDLFYGLMLRGEGALTRGARLTLLGRTGRVKRTEWRALILEQDDGTEIRIHYSRAANAIINREPVKSSIQGRALEFLVGPDVDSWQFKQRILELAINHPYSLTSQWPELQLERVADGQILRLTVHTPGPEFALELERDLRLALEAS